MEKIYDETFVQLYYAYNCTSIKEEISYSEFYSLNLLLFLYQKLELGDLFGGDCPKHTSVKPQVLLVRGVSFLPLTRERNRDQLSGLHTSVQLAYLATSSLTGACIQV